MVARGWFAPIFLFSFDSDASDQITVLATAFQLHPSLGEECHGPELRPATVKRQSFAWAQGKTTRPSSIRPRVAITSHHPTLTGIDRRIPSQARSEHQVNSVSLTRNLHHAGRPEAARAANLADLSGTIFLSQTCLT